MEAPGGSRDGFLEWLANTAAADAGGLSMRRVATAVAIVVAAVVARKWLMRFLEGRVRRWTERTPSDFDDRLLHAGRGPIGFLTLVAGLFLAATVLGLPSEPTDVRGLVFDALKTMAGLGAVWFAWQAVGAFDTWLQEGLDRLGTGGGSRLLPLVRKSLRVVVVAIGLVMVLQNLGYSVSSLIAGLGIGGLAFAFAARETIANLFGSVSILVDRPFVIGDLIQARGIEGNVEDIGFRSTKIRTLEKSLVSIPNNLLANEVVENLQRRDKRRVRETLGFAYGTTPEQVRRAIERIRSILHSHPEVDPEDCHVVLFDLGPSSLDILISFFIRRPGWAEYLACRHEIFLEILEGLAEVGVEIAFPAQTVHLAATDPIRVEAHLDGDGHSIGRLSRVRAKEVEVGEPRQGEGPLARP